MSAGEAAFGAVRRQGNGRLVQGVIAALCLVLVCTALVPTLLQVFMDKPLYYADASFTLGNFAAIFGDPEIRAAAGATLLFCAMTVALSMLIGTAGAILLARTDMPGKALLGAVFFWPLYLSSQVIGFGAIIAYGPRGLMTLWFEQLTGLDAPWTLYSLTGMAVITAIANAPITTLYCIVAARQQDPSHDAAARVMGAGPLRILSRISLPLMRPALIFALIMNIANAVEALAIPLIIGGPVHIPLLTTLIYERSLQAAGIPQYGVVAALALLVVGFVGLLFLAQRLLLRRAHRFVSIGPRAGGQRMLALGAWRWPAFAALATYVALAIVAIIGAVILRSFTFVLSPMVPLAESFTWDNFAELLTIDSYRRSILNTVLLAVLGGALGTVLIAAVALVAQRSDHPLHRLIDGVAQLPRVIPGLIVGLGVFYAAVYIPGLGAWDAHRGPDLHHRAGPLRGLHPARPSAAA